jgi:hypothetical protein
VVDKVHPFVAGYFGKERRQFEEEIDGTGDVGFFGRCAPLFGVKGGVLYDVSPNWSIGPAVGVAVNLRDGEHTAVLAELEANYFTASRAYIGTGIGVYDLFDGDDISPTVLLNFGVPIAKGKTNGQLYLTGEGRLMLDELDDADSNYMFWGGLRYHF